MGRARAARWTRFGGVAAVTVALSLTVAAAASLGTTSKRLTTATETSVSVTNPTPSVCTLRSTADTFAEQDRPFSTNDGAEIRVKSGPGTDIERTYLRFDLAGNCAATGVPMPGGSTVVSATLGLYVYNAPVEDRTYEVRYVTQDWAEATLTWANRPLAAGSVTSTGTTGTANDVWRSWVVTSDVRAFLEGSLTNRGWRLIDTDEAAGAVRESRFCSKDGGGPLSGCDVSGNNDERPRLRIDYLAP